MLYSMTGFGKAVSETADKKITVEIKSLNSKQMDLSVRLPHQYHDQEGKVRGTVARHLQRGKADMIITVESTGECKPAALNIDALKAYKAQIQEISRELGIPEPADWYNTLLRLPDTLHTESQEDTGEDEVNALANACEEAVGKLMDYRRTEGEKLEEFFAVRIGRIKELLGKVPRYENERVEKIKARIKDNLEQLHEADYDKGRFEQEMIFYIEKLDINEEKQRLGQHLEYFMETMHKQEGGQGKKLGFISQEIGREINTLGSKSNHAELQKIVVMMKDELEQIKEQVLNVM